MKCALCFLIMTMYYAVPTHASLQLFEQMLDTFGEADRPNPDELASTVYLGHCLRRRDPSILLYTALLVAKTGVGATAPYTLPYVVFVSLNPESDYEGTTVEDMLNLPVARYPSVLGEDSMDILPIQFPDGDTTMPGKLRIFTDDEANEYPVIVFSNDGAAPSMACLYDRISWGPAERAV